jgi:hypothetical protein
MSEHDHVTLHNCPCLLDMQATGSLRTANVATDEEVRALKRADCAQPKARALRRQQAGFGGHQVGSRPSFSVLGCWCAVAEVNAALRRFLPVAKARAGSALAGR